MSFVIYDVETTGLNKRYDQIIQFGTIRLDANLNLLDRFEIRSRLQPHIIPSPMALEVTGTSMEDLLDATRPSHFQMVCEIDRVLRKWAPSVLLGYNSIGFDEEFLRHALYQSLLDPYLTNNFGNARGDVLRLARAAVHFRPDEFQSPLGTDGNPTMRLQELAASLGYAPERGHEAMADVEATTWVCQVVAKRAPEVWARFLQFTGKGAAVNFMRDEDSFVLFHPAGRGRGCYVVSAFGRHPVNANLHYCIDLSADLDRLRRLPQEELTEIVAAPGTVWRVKANAAPLLFPTYEGLEKAFHPLSEDDAARIAASLRADEEFVARLMVAAVANERIYPASQHVEDQLYEGFFDNNEKFLMAQFHANDWAERVSLIPQMRDSRLRRLAQRILYFERPDLLEPSVVTELSKAIRGRHSGEGEQPWRTLSMAQRELTLLESKDSPALSSYRSYLLWLAQCAPGS